MTRPNSKLNIMRVTVVLLAVALLLPCFPAVALADSGSCGDNVSWSLTGGVLQIKGSGKMTNFTEENPAPWCENATAITKVVVGEGVTRIGSYAFCGFGKLTSVVLPNTLERIGTKAFANCSSLNYLSFPSNLKVIGDSAFESCSSLNGIRLNQGLASIYDYAFYRCGSIVAITVPETVSYFGKVVFAYCENLSQVTILNNITKLPNSTFYGCKSLQNVVLPSTLVDLGQLTFDGCKALEIVHYKGTLSKTELKDMIVGSNENVSKTFEVSSNDFNGESYSTKSIAEPMDTQSVVAYYVVKETKNSTITVSVTETSTYKINGEVVILQDAFDNMENTNVVVEKEIVTSVSGTVENDDGWDELTTIVSELEFTEKGNDIVVNVNMAEETVTKSELAKLSGKETTITTSDGTVWVLPSDNQRADYKNETYNLSTSVVQTAETYEDIASDTIFEVDFGSTTDFKASTGIQLGFSRSIATLFQVIDDEVQKIQSTIIDNDGIAWFNLANTDEETEYLVGIDVEGITKEEAVIPRTLYYEYGISLADQVFMNGITYAVTGRQSSWGITGAQFALYVALAIVTVVIVVGIVMITLNNKKIAARKAALAHGVVPEDWVNDDEETDSTE